MTAANYKAKVRKNGTLTLPRGVREALGVQEGDEVEVIVRRMVKDAGMEPPMVNPLLRIVGLGKGGAPDGAENHDTYLYGADHREPT